MASLGREATEAEIGRVLVSTGTGRRPATRARPLRSKRSRTTSTTSGARASAFRSSVTCGPWSGMTSTSRSSAIRPWSRSSARFEASSA